MEAILTESQLEKLVSFNLTEQRTNEFQDKYDSMSDEAKEILINIQIHARKNEDVGQLEKVGKFKTTV
jgi:hypothetical protein